MEKILIIEDDVNLGTTLVGVLESHNYIAKLLTGGSTVMQTIKEFQPKVILLDVILNEKLDGFEVAQRIRTKYLIPIIFTTSREGNDDLITGFSINNTDYVRKPYRIVEVMKRIEKMLQQTQTTQSFKLGKYTFVPGERALKFACDNINLNNLESAVLTVLCENPSIFMSRAEIIQKVWKQPDPKIKDRSLNNVLSSLRRHLQKDNLIEIECKSRLGVRIVIKK
jgi:two-component system, OmpR family, response regulator TrcR